jgi:hypothetical protein
MPEIDEAGLAPRTGRVAGPTLDMLPGLTPDPLGGRTAGLALDSPAGFTAGVADGIPAGLWEAGVLTGGFCAGARPDVALEGGTAVARPDPTAGDWAGFGATEIGGLAGNFALP